MSFFTNETANSQPVTCYTFRRGATLWHYTDQPEDVTLSGVTYRAAAIAHGDFERSDETAAGELTITLSDATPIVSEMNATGIQGQPVICTIRQTHRSGVGGVTPVTVVRFKGSVTARTLTPGRCELRVAALPALFERPLLRVLASPTCNNAVYDRLCAVNPASFTTTGCAVSGISGFVLTVASAALQADGYYTAGIVVVETGPAAGERLFVAAHAGSSLTVLTSPPPGFTTSHTVSLLAGCDGTEATCLARFNNQERFLGFPRVPSVNPFTRAD